MKIDNWRETLPGGELVGSGLADLALGLCTVPACLVSIARTRLASAGLLPSSSSGAIPEPELQLYRLLRKRGGDAYSRYNALLRELVSFEQALDRRAGRQARDASSITVAEILGSTPHLSPLLRKVNELGFDSPDALLRLAVKRGCSHYAPSDYEPSAVNDPGYERLSDAELAIALVSGAQEYDPQRVRCAAQLLGGRSITPETVARLAVMERCEPVIAWIAQAALKYDEPEHHARWTELLDRMHVRRPIASGRLPHPSRFTLQTGITGPKQLGAPRAVWLRPALRSIDER